jgi:hypothetical protein
MTAKAGVITDTQIYDEYQATAFILLKGNIQLYAIQYIKSKQHVHRGERESEQRPSVEPVCSPAIKMHI